MAERDPNGHKVVSSSGKFMGWNTIHRLETGDRYMTRFWIGRLRLHIFHRGDEDPDPHDHPWDFWTFPLVSYVEEVTVPSERGHQRYTSIVPAWHWNFRPATHTHRVKGAWSGAYVNEAGQLIDPDDPLYDHGYLKFEPTVVPGKKIVTLIWRSAEYRRWGFLKNREGKWCWIGWKDYVLGGGKNAPCE
ncbi:MAG: hypothetical protein DI537_20310 [Stutzerimonas stutzeri]|nr:MAG: hypothetical protein DI537_20310 [Stutzerimonas stutzeri]